MRKVLAIILWAGIPFCWHSLWGQTPSVGKDAGKKKPDNSSTDDKSTDKRGTKENPLVVDTLGHQQTPIERQESEKQATKAEADEQYHRGIDRWTLRWSGITAIATGVLVFIGIGGVIAALCTLREIRAQTKATEASVKVLIHSERAWVVTQPAHPTPELMPALPGMIGAPQHMFCYRIWNAGKTTATDIRTFVKYILLDELDSIPVVPEYGDLQVFPGVLIPTANSQSDNALWSCRLLEHVPTLFEPDIEAIKKRQKFLYAYGIVKYGNGVGEEGVTKFGLVYHFPIPGEWKPTGFQVAGPSAYNDAK
jgi:hypothetical protein